MTYDHRFVVPTAMIEEASALFPRQTPSSLQVTIERAKRLALALVGGVGKQQRTVNFVNQTYSKRWLERSLSEFDVDGEAPAYLVAGDRALIANPRLSKRIQLLHLARAIEIIKPMRVLEVGSGQGVNLAMLSRAFPEISFSGIELTLEGVEYSQRLCSKPLPDVLRRFMPFPVAQETAIRVDIRQGTAEKLP